MSRDELQLDTLYRIRGGDYFYTTDGIGCYFHDTRAAAEAEYGDGFQRAVIVTGNLYD